MPKCDSSTDVETGIGIVNKAGQCVGDDALRLLPLSYCHPGQP